MARCNSCGLMASADLEVDGVEFIGAESMEESEEEPTELTVELSAQLRQVSQCCGEDLSTCETEDSIAATLQHTPECDVELREYSGEVTDEDPTDWYDGKPRKDGTMPPARYQRHFWGVEVSVKVTCDNCSAEAEGSGRFGEPGSAFDAA